MRGNAHSIGLPAALRAVDGTVLEVSQSSYRSLPFPREFDRSGHHKERCQFDATAYRKHALTRQCCYARLFLSREQGCIPSCEAPLKSL